MLGKEAEQREEEVGGWEGNVEVGWKGGGRGVRGEEKQAVGTFLPPPLAMGDFGFGILCPGFDLEAWPTTPTPPDRDTAWLGWLSVE